MMFIDHRYRVLETLGSGTWANVYKVQDVRTGNLYSLKLFQFLSSEELYKHFRPSEMHHITKIEHPNLVHVVDFGHVGDHIYFISDYFEGSTLSGFRFAKNKVNALYNIIVQICYALDALHTQNIIHKDLKPENILYSISGNNLEVKLIDYGFSRMELDKDTQYVSGTLPYIAPEVYLGQGSSFSSDFYSLGVLIYRLITGSFPFSLDQINALRSGSQQYFIPIFPSELNPNVPLHLEKLCLRLLERNPDNRFKTSEEVINYINRIQSREYPFSVSWSLVNSLKFNSYLVREGITEELLEYMKQVENGNGKIISLLGGEGLGKDNILSLFRYNVLRGSYFIFDYTCTRNDHEAFFALIKEYLHSIPDEEAQAYKTPGRMSEKLYQYLFESEKESKRYTQNQEDLKLDFDFAKSLLEELAGKKPVVFIVRNIQYVHHYTIDFLNYIATFVGKSRLLMLLSCTEYNRVRQIEQAVLIRVPLFNLEQSENYISKLLNSEVPQCFSLQLHERSAGNPYFIREILIDLILRKQVYFDDTLKYPASLDGYALPSRLLHSVYSRMSHLTDASYSHLQKLSIVQTPLSRELIRYICKIKDIELYDLLSEGKFNELLEKKGDSYYFTFKEAKARLFNECTDSKRKLISLKTLKYYSTHETRGIDVYRGLIENSRIAKDPASERNYLIKLFEYYDRERDQSNAYSIIADILEMDFNSGLELGWEAIAEDLMRFQEKTEYTGLLNRSDAVLGNQNLIPEKFEKHIVIGTIQMLSEDYANAIRSYKKAEKRTTGKEQKAISLIMLAGAVSFTDHTLMGQFIDGIDTSCLSLPWKIAYVNIKSKYQFLNKETDRAIETAEDFLAIIMPEQQTSMMIRLAILHNDLGEYYSAQKNVTEADTHFNLALGILSRYNINRWLAQVHNNLSDLYLKQGFTIQSVQHAKLGLSFAKSLGNRLAQARAQLGMGEAMIKMGDFYAAEIELNSAAELLKTLKSTQYLATIQSNLALAKSKIKGFGYYYQFIIAAEKDLIEDHFSEINPLVKTYFYYLSEMSNPRKLRRLIRKNSHIDYQQINELEFYHNVLSLLATAENDYPKSLQELKLAMQYAGEINNHYALAVFNVMLVNAYYGMGEYAKARELIELTQPEIGEYQYGYWDSYLQIITLKLDLVDPAIPLRSILRKANRQFGVCEAKSYYQLMVELYKIKMHVLLDLGADETAADTFEQYKDFLDNISQDINSEDRKNYLQINQHNINDLKAFNQTAITSRRRDTRKKWNDLLFNIANVNSVQRVKFLIEKGVSQVIAPWQFKLMVWSDRIANFYTFLCHNCSEDMLLPPEFAPHIDKALGTDSIIHFSHKTRNILVVPMLSGSKRIGFLLLSDDGELAFTPGELGIIRNIKNHLTALMIRTWDYMQITLRMEKMNRLMRLSHDLIKIVDLDVLETEIVSAAIDFTNATRGFMIKKDEEGNNLYQVRLDQDKQLLPTVVGISKTALSLCQTNQEWISSYNASLDKRFRSSISVQDYAIQTIFCCPLVLDDTSLGYLYLDNYGDTTREMYLNEDDMALLIKQIGIAAKNARQYATLIQKSKELNALEQIKDEFIAIVSHELNTPLTSLQGYVSRLKRNLYIDEEEKGNILGKLEQTVNKLMMSVNDITTMNLYNIAKSLIKAPVNIPEILELAHQEVSILSRKRHLQFKVEVEKDLPNLNANWEALHRMIYNVVLNAVRFTNEFGSVIIGARRSAFPQEMINNKDTLVIYVQDNGIGIPEYRLKDIFRKFYELNEIYAHKSGSVEYRSSGLGLGLAIARRIAELHDGDMVIKSKENEGTSVFILLPFK